MADSDQIYAFDDFCLDGIRRTLTRNGEPCKIADKTFDLLHYLVRNHGRAIRKQELQAGVWADGRTMTEAAVKFHLGCLYQILGDTDRHNPKYIAPGNKSYYFVAAVVLVERSMYRQLRDTRLDTQNPVDGAKHPDGGSSFTAPEVSSRARGLTESANQDRDKTRVAGPIDRMRAADVASQGKPSMDANTGSSGSTTRLERWRTSSASVGRELAEFFRSLTVLVFRPRHFFGHPQIRDRFNNRDATRFVLLASGSLAILYRFFQHPSELRAILYVVLYTFGIPLLCCCLARLLGPRVRLETLVAVSCYVAVGYGILLYADYGVVNLAIRFGEPGCNTGGIDCNVYNVNPYLGHFVTPVGIDVVRPSRQPGPPSTIYAVATFGSYAVRLLWVALAWLGLKRRFSSRAMVLLVSYVAFVALTWAGSWTPMWLWFAGLPPGAPCGIMAPEAPALNIWPVAYPPNWTPCHDFPLIDASNLDSSDQQQRRLAWSQAEHDLGIKAHVGDRLEARVYFENGASDINSSEAASARHVRVRLTIKKSSETEHLISAELWADNAKRVRSSDIGRGGDRPVHLLQSGRLTYVHRSAYLCITPRHAAMLGADTSNKCLLMNVRVPLSDDIFEAGVDIGSLPAGYTGFAVAEITVVPDLR